ncbi:MAG: MerR family transcriptional regulator [Lachnospiraceae bacterium]|nr:MerR family transcriptional regulator [Lachnospiraceae bacterium]
MGEMMMISDAAKEVQVESHVLRYWEEELQIPIKRNEMGHRYYTGEDVERFRKIKNMKDRGLQLKAIKMILRDGSLSILEEDEREISGKQPVEKVLKAEEGRQEKKDSWKSHPAVDDQVSGAEKARKLQWILQRMIREAVRQNNEEICSAIKESVLKELDYQFRMQEEREDKREREAILRSEEYYRKMDELLRKKSLEKTEKGKHFWEKWKLRKGSEEPEKGEVSSERGRYMPENR